MANNVNIFEKFGIKEVANVYFEALAKEEENGIEVGDIVLFLDSLKVSTIETTAEQVDARGGWGNPKLVTWDFGKEITLSLTDALLSFESARVMLGGKIKQPKGDATVTVRYTARQAVNSEGILSIKELQNPSTKEAFPKGDMPDKAVDGVRFINETKGIRGKAEFTEDSVTLKDNAGNEIVLTKKDNANDIIRFFWAVEKKESSEGYSALEITISPDVFPGTYRIVGDTFMRSAKDGKDRPFQFVINKAKVASEVTITMEAEGDPSVFDMTISVLRDESGEMMKWVRYDYVEDDNKSTNDDPEAGE